MEDSTIISRCVPKEEDKEDFHINSMKHKESVDSLSTVSGLSSSSSTTFPTKDVFRPLYSVKLSNRSVKKDGDAVYYTITSRSLTDGSYKEISVARQYEDFEYLHHCLVTSVFPGHGLITPPLPPQPAITPRMAQERSREKLGSSTRTLIPDEWHKDCWHLQEYLRLMLNHPAYGHHQIWEQFLRSHDPPPRAKVKKSLGLIDKISDSLEKSKSNHRDCDEFFQHERDWVQTYSSALKTSSEAFNSIINARLKLCGVLAHLSTALNLNLGDNESNINRAGTKFSNLFSLALDEYRVGLEVINYNDEASLGASLDLWTRYVEAEKEMLFKRTCLLYDYENSNRNLDRAKPNKREAVSLHEF